MPRFDKEYQEYLRGECKDYNQSLISALEETEKGGETMPKYGDDQCEECGGIRVAKSFLCADCLVKACARERQEKESLQKMVDKANLEITKYNSRLEEVIRYGFTQNQEIAKLHRYIGELEAQIASEWEADLW